MVPYPMQRCGLPQGVVHLPTRPMTLAGFRIIRGDNIAPSRCLPCRRWSRGVDEPTVRRPGIMVSWMTSCHPHSGTSRKQMFFGGPVPYAPGQPDQIVEDLACWACGPQQFTRDATLIRAWWMATRFDKKSSRTTYSTGLPPTFCSTTLTAKHWLHRLVPVIPKRKSSSAWS